MIKFLKKIAQTNLGIKLRNYFGLKVIKVNLKNLEKNHSISDVFVWRTDNSYKTIVHYSDILKQFFELEDSTINVHIFNNKNQLLKIIKNKNPKHLNELIIDKALLDNYESYGTFFIFHENNVKINTSIRNSCYTGFSKNNNLPSFVHGNLMGASMPINNDINKKFKYGIIENSFLKNNIYKIQKSFSKYDKVELFFSNPTGSKIYFVINKKKYVLNIGQSIIITIKKVDTVAIKSNCFFLRPIAFIYKNEYIDVFHC
tara:strand:+ start:2259 stop:3032 length:774 start_codon:yes stop_codon:yes gene_type:complete